MKNILTVIVAASTTLISLSYADVPSGAIASSGTPLSLTECIELSQNRSVQMVQASLNATKTEAMLQEARSQKLPQLTGNVQLSETNNLSTQLNDANSIFLAVQQKAYPFSQIWLQADQTAKDFEATKKGVLETQQDVELLVKQLYFDILLDSDLLANISKVEAVLEDLLATFLPKYNVGGVPVFDLAQVRTAILELNNQKTITKAQQKAQKSRLAQILGRSAESDLELKSISSFPEIPRQQKVESKNETKADSFDFSFNPTFERLHLQIEAAEVGVKVANAGYLPSLTVALQTDYSGATPSDLSPGWTFLVGLQVPILNWGQIAAQVQRQSIERNLRETQLELVQQQVRADFIQARELAAANLENEKKFKDLLNDVHTASIVSIERYKRRATSILEVAGAMNLWMGALSNERNAYYSYLGALAQMERYLGTSQSVHY